MKDRKHPTRRPRRPAAALLVALLAALLLFAPARPVSAAGPVAPAPATPAIRAVYDLLALAVWRQGNPPIDGLTYVNAEVGDWITRVVAASGSGSLNQTEVSAADTLVTGLKSAGIWTKMIAGGKARINLLCGTNLAAASVPLLVTSGFGNATDDLSSFVAGDYSRTLGILGGAAKGILPGINGQQHFDKNSASAGEGVYFLYGYADSPTTAAQEALGSDNASGVRNNFRVYDTVAARRGIGHRFPYTAGQTSLVINDERADPSALVGFTFRLYTPHLNANGTAISPNPNTGPAYRGSMFSAQNGQYRVQSFASDRTTTGGVGNPDYAVSDAMIPASQTQPLYNGWCDAFIGIGAMFQTNNNPQIRDGVRGRHYGYVFGGGAGAGLSSGELFVAGRLLNNAFTSLGRNKIVLPATSVTSTWPLTETGKWAEIRIPCFVSLPNGQYAAVAEGRPHATDISNKSVIFNLWTGTGWRGEQEIVLHGFARGGLVTNPSLCYVADGAYAGRLILLFTHYNTGGSEQFSGPSNYGVYITWSDNWHLPSGGTWATPVEITANVSAGTALSPGTGLFFVGPNAGVTLTRGPHRGRVCFAAGVNRNGLNNAPGSPTAGQTQFSSSGAIILYSDNLKDLANPSLATWGWSAPTEKGGDNEPTIAEQADGSLLLGVRCDGDTMGSSGSANNNRRAFYRVSWSGGAPVLSSRWYDDDLSQITTVWCSLSSRLTPDGGGGVLYFSFPTSGRTNPTVAWTRGSPGTPGVVSGADAVWNKRAAITGVAQYTKLVPLSNGVNVLAAEDFDAIDSIAFLSGTGASRGVQDADLPSGVAHLAVSPPGAAIAPGLAFPLSSLVTVLGGAGTGVTWSVDGLPAEVTVSASGLVTTTSAAPVGSYTIRAVSNTDGTVAGTATVSVRPTPTVTRGLPTRTTPRAAGRTR